MTVLCGQSSNLYMLSLLDFINSISWTDDVQDRLNRRGKVDLLAQGRSDGGRRYIGIYTDMTDRGVATGGGGISVYIPPKSVTVLFTCGTLTHVLKLQ